MSTPTEVASLFAALGLQVNTAQWAAGNDTISKMQAKLGAFQDSQGRWRASSGRFLTTAEKQAAGLGAGLGKVGREADHAGQQLGGMWALAAAGAALVGVEHLEHTLIGFNQEVQDSKISLSAMISGMTGAEWGKATGQADALYNEFQRFSTVTPVTTQQILDFGKGIAAATFAAGGGVEELKNLTEQGVIAAKVLAGNRGAGYAELEITELLSGVVNKRMILARQLLSMGHMTEEAFKALDGKGRIAALQKIFNSDAMNHARDAFGESFSGVTSTLWDKLQIMFGQVGKPLFDEIIVRVKELNEWMQTNKATVEEYARKVGERLVGAFDALVTVFRFVTDHAVFFEGVLIGTGALITAFAVQAAIDWAIAFWPLTAAVAAIAALHAAWSWLFGDLDEATNGIDTATSSVSTLDNSRLDTLNDAFGGVQSAADRTRSAIDGVAKATRDANQTPLHDFHGNPIQTNWGERSAALATATRAQTPPPQVWMGRAAADMPTTAPAVRPDVTFGRATSDVTVKPQINVTVTGNMPEGWIDTKINTAIEDHHDEVMSNAAYATQAEDDE